MVVRWQKLGEVENECISDKFILFVIFFAKKNHSWWEFDKVLAKNNFAQFFWDTVHKQYE